MRLRVKIKNSKDCRTELNFPDLSVKYGNGWAPSLRIKEGEEIPLDVLDPEDVRKSLKVGSLQGYLANDWIEEFTENIIIIESKTPISQFITEQMVLAPKVDLIKKEEVVLPKQLDIPSPSNLSEAVKEVKQKQISVPQNESITDLKLVNSFEDFNKLSHFLKLRFIKETDKIELLKDISDKTPSAQFKNNIALRLSTIKI